MYVLYVDNAMMSAENANELQKILYRCIKYENHTN